MLYSKDRNKEQDRWETALEAANVGVWNYTPQSGELVWSRKCYELFGLSPDRPITLETFLKALHPDDREKTERMMAQALDPAGNGEYDIEYRTTGMDDKKLRWIRAIGKAYFDDAGGVSRFTGTVTEITQEKKAIAALQENEARLRDITNASPAVLWMTDEQGNLVFINQTWTDWTGNSVEAQLGKGWSGIMLPEDYNRTASVFYRAMAERKYCKAEFRIKNKEGAIRWCMAGGIPRYNASGDFIGYTGFCTDITERKQDEEAQQFKTALLEAQNEATSDGILVVDARGQILSCNHRYEQIWNIPKSIIEAKSHPQALEYAINQLEDPQGFMDRIRYLYAHPQELALDELHFKNGQIIERQGRPVIGENNTYYGWVWYFRDVTQRKKEEEALRFRTALLEAQQEASADGILITDGRDKILYANRRFAELWNMPASIIEQGDNAASLAYGMKQLADPQSAMEKVQHLYSNPNESVDDELLFKDGKILERRGRPVIGTDGTYYGWAWYFRDITERKGAEQGLKQKNEELQNLLTEFRFVTDLMPQILWAAQPDGNLDFFNLQWYEYSGTDYDHSKGFGWVHWLHAEDVDRTIEAWNRSLQSGQTYENEFRLRRRDGAYRWHLTRAIPLRNEAGTIIKWYGSTTDIHDQKTQEELLEQKVAERTTELQDANKSLEHSNTELEQFAYVASHDLQEPLRKIRTFINMLEREMEGGKTDRSKLFMDKILNASDRMNTLIKDLLNFSRVSRAAESAFEMTDLNVLLKNTLEDLELMIAQKKATIEYDPLPRMKVVPLQIGQLFYNLINNSLKFSKEDEPPHITIRCRELPPGPPGAFPSLDPKKAYYELVFRDNGIGFDMEYAEQVFTIFQRLNARSSYEGTGIGLAICKKIVASHHGEIFARSEEGKGAEFHVLLPATGTSD